MNDHNLPVAGQQRYGNTLGKLLDHGRVGVCLCVSLILVLVGIYTVLLNLR